MSHHHHIKRNCGCKLPCGCGDHVLTTPPACGTGNPDCVNPEKCSETFSSECAIYMGDTIANLNIYKGDRLTTVVQKLAQALLNPGCAMPTSPCTGVVGFGSYIITQGTIALSWLAAPSAITYQVEYRAITSAIWLLNPAVAGLTDTIAGLLPNTDYYVRVNSQCNGFSCYSLVLQITTKA